jgi:hypothetical protein
MGSYLHEEMNRASRSFITECNERDAHEQGEAKGDNKLNEEEMLMRHHPTSMRGTKLGLVVSKRLEREGEGEGEGDLLFYSSPL